MFQIYKGRLAPSVEDTISVDGVPVNLTQAEVRFQMRAANDTPLVVDALATILDPLTGGVRYDWGEGDTATPGDFVAWWVVTLPECEPQDSGEFPIRVLEHAPGGFDLVTLEDVRLALGTSDIDHKGDPQIVEFLHFASARIMELTNRELVPVTTQTRRFRVDPAKIAKTSFGTPRGYMVDFKLYDLQVPSERTPVTVTFNPETAAPVTLAENVDFILAPYDHRGGVYTRMEIHSLSVVPTSYAQMWWGYSFVDVHGTWGFPSVPQTIKDACIECVMAWLDRRVAAAMPVETTDAVGMPARSFGYDVPATIKRKLTPWTRGI